MNKPSSAPLAAVTMIAMIAGGCVSESNLRNIGDTDANADGIPDSPEGPSMQFNPSAPDLVAIGDDDDSAEISVDPGPFSLSDLTRDCIPDPIACPPEDSDCDAVNTTLADLSDLWAEVLGDFYDEPVDPEALLDGEYDDRMQATGYVWDDTGPDGDGGMWRGVGAVAIPGPYPRDEVLYMANNHNYQVPQLKCGIYEHRDANGDFISDSGYAGMTGPDTVTWRNQTGLDLFPGSAQGVNHYLFYTPVEPGYSAVAGWVIEHALKMDDLAQGMANLSAEGELHGALFDGLENQPIATTQLVE